MERYIFFLLILIISGCDTLNKSKFEGEWLDKKSEMNEIIIQSNGDNFIIDYQGKKYPATLEKSILSTNIRGSLIQLFINEDTGNLLVSGEEYISKEKAISPKYAGVWYNDRHSEILYITFEQR